MLLPGGVLVTFHAAGHLGRECPLAQGVGQRLFGLDLVGALRQAEAVPKAVGDLGSGSGQARAAAGLYWWRGLRWTV